MTRAEKAVELFGAGFNCSQAVLLAFSDQKDLAPGTAARLASGFGGGMGCMGGVCGAVTGAFMVLGLRHGPATSEDKAAKAEVYRMVQEFATRFRGQHGAIDCRDLLGCDISTAAGLDEAKKKGLFGTVCPKMVREAAEILEVMV